MNRPFQKRFTGTRLSPEAAERQGRATRIAFEALQDSSRAVAFLNTVNDSLGGRPIDLAIASDEGLATVERAIATLT